DDALRVLRASILGPEIYLIVGREEGRQIFRSDGTQAGTRPVFDLRCELYCGFDPNAEQLQWARAGDGVYFSFVEELEGGVGESRLYRTDGTPEGTRRIL